MHHYIVWFLFSGFRFQVKHSKTSSPSSYEKDLRELVEIYSKGRNSGKRNNLICKSLEDAPSTVSNLWDDSNIKPDTTDSDESLESDDESLESDDETEMSSEYSSPTVTEKKLSVEYLEDECDDIQDVDDFDGNVFM